MDEASNGAPESVRETFETVIEHTGGAITINPVEGTERVLGITWLGVEEKIGGKTADSVAAELPEIGIELSVDQASYGYTGISARPLEGFGVESLDFDADTKVPVWKKPENEQGSVVVASDRGNLQILEPGVRYAKESYGNPGMRTGVVKVTGKTGDMKYYALAAMFEGRPDNWNVRRAISEVSVVETPSSPPAANA